MFDENAFAGHTGVTGSGVSETACIETGSGAPLLLVHDGAPGADAASNWYACIGPLSERCRVIAPDMLGFGNSARPDPAGFAYSHDARVHHLLEFTAALHLENINVIGFSLGGAVAIGLARCNPGLVKKLILVGPAGFNVGIPAELGPLMAYEGREEQMRELIRALGNSAFEPDPALVSYRTRLSNRPANAAAWGAAMGWLGVRGGLTFDSGVLAPLTMPVLLVSGSVDPIMTPEVAATALQCFANAESHILPDCGHWPMFETSDRFNDLCTGFLA